MNYEKINEIMLEIGLPYAYHHFAEGESPEPPFMLFYSVGENNFSADNSVFFSSKKLNFELYTDRKNPGLEGEIEAVFRHFHIFYTKSEAWISSEKMYEILYQTEVLFMDKNKVKFGLNKVHWAKILGYDEDGIPTYDKPVRLPGAVNLSFDASGENSPFYADNCIYYMCNNNSGYEGDLEIALVPTDFATAILNEILDTKGVLVEKNNVETAEFALFFEFDGDKNKIRHVLYRCSVSRPGTESATIEDSKEVKTEKLSIKISALENGLVKSKSCESTDATVYNDWYKSVYMPVFTAPKNAVKSA